MKSVRVRGWLEFSVSLAAASRLPRTGRAACPCCGGSARLAFGLSSPSEEGGLAEVRRPAPRGQRGWTEPPRHGRPAGAVRVARVRKEAATYIQSGNVIIFSAARTPRAGAEISHGARGRARSTAAGVIVRSAVALARALEANPFTDAASARLHLCFLARGPRPDRPSTVARSPGSLPAGALRPPRGRELYLRPSAHGMGQGQAPEATSSVDFARWPLTARNWNTVVRLVELAGA